MSHDRGSRVVHYYLKDRHGHSSLAVIGNERSLRHMVYVVCDDFLPHTGLDKSTTPAFKWRARREVVDWLQSLLFKTPQPPPLPPPPSCDPYRSSGTLAVVPLQWFSMERCEALIAKKSSWQKPQSSSALWYACTSLLHVTHAMRDPMPNCQWWAGDPFLASLLSSCNTSCLREESTTPLVNTGMSPEEQGSSNMLPDSKRGRGMQTTFLLPG